MGRAFFDMNGCDEIVLENSNNTKFKYVIVSPRNNGGGAIVLHALCKYLCELGYDAKIFYIGYFNRSGSIFFWYKWIMYVLKDFWMLMSVPVLGKLFPKRYINYVDIPITGLKRKILPVVDENTIVVYPEIAKGNFLKAKNVVRWMLYYNAYKENEISRETDLFVCYRHEFNDKNLNPDEVTLYCPYFNLELYKQTNFEERHGKCYIIRKGRNRSDLPSAFDGIIIDDLPERKKVQVFNKCKYFISYDTQTAYSRIAALCGCISIVAPEPNKTISDYRNEHDKRYGVAIGFSEEEINYAKSTIDLLKDEQAMINKISQKSVEDFTAYCSKVFEINL